MMRKRFLNILSLLAVLYAAGAIRAGEIVVVDDPRYFSHQHQVIFPHAEVKLVAFEFETVGKSEAGKLRAKELHREFLEKIHDLQGGAIITYITPPDKKIENYRVEAEKVARQQKAQMVLWGRILLNRSDTPLINARLILIEAPPGIAATYSWQIAPDNAPIIAAQGAINAPVTQVQVDFHTMEKDVTPLALFLSGLARYYKGSVRDGAQAKRWLRGSIDDFRQYVAIVSEEMDRSALAKANLYLARAYVRLSEVETSQSRYLITLAGEHAAEAARLNPYDPEAPTVQAVVSAKEKTDATTIRAFLARAVQLAPADGNARVNLAVLDGATGNFEKSLRQLENASFVQKAQDKERIQAIQKMRRQLEEYQEKR